MSTKPGVTSKPLASITVAPVASSCRPTSATTPSTMRTSPIVAGVPVPSATRPLRMTRAVVVGMPAVSQFGCHHLDVAEAFAWGLLGASSLVLGALLVSVRDPGSEALGLVMGFGAGVLFSAVSFELFEEAVATSTTGTAMGFFLG